MNPRHNLPTGHSPWARRGILPPGGQIGFSGCQLTVRPKSGVAPSSDRREGTGLSCPPPFPSPYNHNPVLGVSEQGQTKKQNLLRARGPSSPSESNTTWELRQHNDLVHTHFSSTCRLCAGLVLQEHPCTTGDACPFPALPVSLEGTSKA